MKAGDKKKKKKSGQLLAYHGRGSEVRKRQTAFPSERRVPCPSYPAELISSTALGQEYRSQRRRNGLCSSIQLRRAGIGFRRQIGPITVHPKGQRSVQDSSKEVLFHRATKTP
ncbi:hypothetical protein EYF80_026118 [Liparis tanakae]|uniref:Uncharacterized protein n=1 Tax=Liparis tanakae TaxID=230148 RepID=A0A4Z2HDT4_9TELE|nr:hypothetical protein EYF80_026118 [Liparis tanakae]